MSPSRPLFPLLATALVALLGAPLPAQSAPWWSESVAAALDRAGANVAELRAALDKAPVAQRRGMAFLIEHMPEKDLRALSAEFLLENVALAYRARDEVPWGAAVPEAVFLNDVLPYAQVSETREAWRAGFRERFLPLVQDCATPGAAAQVLNEKIFGLLGVRYSTRRKRADQSPAESIETGMASCTGLSILLADACRAVGVPARLAGIPRWVNKRGNHTWIEVWDGGWHFTGAAEPDGRGLDHTWFQGDAALAKKGSRDHAIYAVSYRTTGTIFPMVWARDADPVHAVDVTERYSKPQPDADGAMRLMVRVLGPGGARVAATVRIVDTGERERAFAGQSRDESADTNDVLEFAVPAGRTWRIAVAVDGGDGGDEVVRVHESRAADQEIVTIRLSGGDDGLRTALAAYFAADTEARASWRFQPELDELLRADDAKVRKLAWEAYRRAPIHAARRADLAADRVREGGYESPFTLREVGKRPENGWPLFIAMHGGGGVRKRVNDGQWRVMQRYYQDQDGVTGYKYLALRAPTDEWNGFYTTYAYPLVAALIRQLLLFGDVDPDRVFLMGYSHGGYGAFAIGPQMPDRFAAVHASAAAPTDGVTAARNLRNTVFTFMIGERDAAYGRIDRCRAFADRIAKLRGDRDDIYPVTMELKEGFGHGGLPDRDKIAAMYPAVRNAVPRELSWKRTDAVIEGFYWLSVTEEKPGQEIEARCADNRIELVTENVGALTLCLDARLVDFGRPIVVKRGDGEKEHELAPSLRTLCESLLARGDPALAYSVRLELE